MAVRTYGAQILDGIDTVPFTNRGKWNDMVNVDEVTSQLTIHVSEVETAYTA